MPITVDAAELELQPMVKADDPVADLRAYAEMSSFLTDYNGALTKALAKLEDQLWTKYAQKTNLTTKMTAVKARGVASKITSDRSGIEASAAKTRKPDDPTRHLLSDCLSEWEQTAGLQVYQVQDGKPRMKPVYMVGTLSSEGFTGQLEKGRQAKDYVGLEHGVFTHRIQWYLIGKSLTLTAQSSILELFERTGRHPFLWSTIFDRQQNLCDQVKDYRKPENLTKYITGSNLSSSWPFLFAIVGRQQEKAAAIPNYQEYVKRIIIKKLFGKWYSSAVKWESIPKTERDAADSAQNTGGIDQSVLYPIDESQRVKAKLPEKKA